MNDSDVKSSLTFSDNEAEETGVQLTSSKSLPVGGRSVSKKKRRKGSSRASVASMRMEEVLWYNYFCFVIIDF